VDFTDLPSRCIEVAIVDHHMIRNGDFSCQSRW